MSRTMNEIVQLQLGGQALEIARLLAENETLKEKVSEFEAQRQVAKAVREPDKPIHLVGDSKGKE